jgi:hypothetical protein
MCAGNDEKKSLGEMKDEEQQQFFSKERSKGLKKAGNLVWGVQPY